MSPSQSSSGNSLFCHRPGNVHQAIRTARARRSLLPEPLCSCTVRRASTHSRPTTPASKESFSCRTRSLPPHPAQTVAISQGLVAGAFGGLISGFVKLGWEVPWPPRAPRPHSRAAGPCLTLHPPPHTAWVSLVIHFTFSIVCGAAYGLLAEIFPIVTLGMGRRPFGPGHLDRRPMNWSCRGLASRRPRCNFRPVSKVRSSSATRSGAW